jgi:hypothetical protein
MLVMVFGSIATQGIAKDEDQPLGSAPELHPPLTTVANPGPLCAAHAHLEGIDHCADCHLIAREPGDRKCLSCHELIMKRKAEARGYHGRFVEGACIECHSDHQGVDFLPIELDAARFNHALSQFPLEGKHLSLACERCHLQRGEKTEKVRFRYLGLPVSCMGCHPTPHSGRVSTECETCHSARGWTGRVVAYDHGQDFGFPLRGAHSEVQCVQCHRKGWGQEVSTSCSACHTDVHQGELGAACESCHDEQRWTNAAAQFDHAMTTGYTLEGRHAGLACIECHGDAPMAEATAACVSCHASPHGDEVSDQCVKCHTVWSWGKEYLTFDHDKDTGYKLGALHRHVACAACHPDGKYTVSDKSCEGCHEDVQSFRLGESAFDKTDHLADPMLKVVKCTDCHAVKDPGVRLFLIRQRCVGCHPSTYGPLLSYWEEKLDRESRQLLEQLTAWAKRMNMEWAGRTSSPSPPTGLQISLSEMTDKYRQTYDGAKRIQRLGVHNLRNAKRELEAALQRFEQMKTLGAVEN